MTPRLTTIADQNLQAEYYTLWWIGLIIGLGFLLVLVHSAWWKRRVHSLWLDLGLLGACCWEVRWGILVFFLFVTWFEGGQLRTEVAGMDQRLSAFTDGLHARVLALEAQFPPPTTEHRKWTIKRDWRFRPVSNALPPSAP